MTDTAYIQEFKSVKDIEDEYGARVPDGAEILVAWYGYGSYCGSSFVLYRLAGKLYEVNGSHCSCHGLEGCWQPEETTVDALRLRDITDECDGSNEAQARLTAVLEEISAQCK